MSDESNVIWYKTVNITWLCTPSGVCRQFCALKCVAGVCLSYFWLQCVNFDLFYITILVCFLFFCFSHPLAYFLTFFFFHIVTHSVWYSNYYWKIFWHKISIYLVWASILISLRSLRNPIPTLILIFASFPPLIFFYIYLFFLWSFQ